MSLVTTEHIDGLALMPLANTLVRGQDKHAQ